MRTSELIEVLAKEIAQNGDNEILRLAVHGNTVAAEMGKIRSTPDRGDSFLEVPQESVNPVCNI